MDAIINMTGRSKGVEVLYFQEAEIQKMRGKTPIFAAMGPLSVLYFKDYDRFVLQVNDWRYPLLRRLNISGSGMTFMLPGMNDTTFCLKILGNPTQDTLKNFETILMNNSRFGGKVHETSPDDKLVRGKPKDMTLMEKVTETAKNIMDSMKAKTETMMKMGTKNSPSPKKRSNMKDIKTKDFKKDAHSTLKKDFFESQEKLTQCFFNKRRENKNLTCAMDYSDLKKTTCCKAGTFFIPKEQVEEAILNNKEIVMAK